MGVQFAQPNGYDEFRLREVRDLFHARYPVYQVHPALPPQFETFGAVQLPSVSVSLNPLVRHNRYWFLSEDERSLVQFQPDRLLRNWRQPNGRPTSDYPGTSALLQSFENELDVWKSYVAETFSETIQINQCEFSYVNHIRLSPDMPDASDWLTALNSSGVDWDDFSCSFQSDVEHGEGNKIGRLYAQIGSGVAVADQQHPGEGESVILLNLTLRGIPGNRSVSAAIEFLADSHDILLDAFLSMTTASAQEAWGRIA